MSQNPQAKSQLALQLEKHKRAQQSSPTNSTHQNPELSDNSSSSSSQFDTATPSNTQLEDLPNRLNNLNINKPSTPRSPGLKTPSPLTPLRSNSSDTEEYPIEIKPVRNRGFRQFVDSDRVLSHGDDKHVSRRKSKKKDAGDRSISNVTTNARRTSSGSDSGTHTPNGNSLHREEPRIHNKLYCDQVKQRRASTKVLSKLGTDDLRSVKSHTELAQTANGVRMLAKSLSKATIQLDVKAIMIVTKARDNSLTYLTREAVEWLFTQSRDITVYVDRHLEKSKRFDVTSLRSAYPDKCDRLLKYWDKKFALKNPEKFDLVLTLGGDGTVLYVSNLFQRIVPPVISFALGSLGFLTNFEFEQFRERMAHVLEAGVRAYLRMRFTCRVHKANGKLVCEQQVLNELVIDRGPSPYVTQLELYGDGSLLTVAQADGLIIATPTGSTAYSLSAGGSLVHPGVSAISVTPICPHTLSFRPILLPDGMFLRVKVPEVSRSTAWASFDGKVRTEIGKGDYVTIQASPFPFPTVISSKTEYIDSVSRNLNWNAREQQKPFTHLLSGPNKDRVGKEEAAAGSSSAPADDDNNNNEEDYDINYDEDQEDEEEQEADDYAASGTSIEKQQQDEEDAEDVAYKQEVEQTQQQPQRRRSNYADSSVAPLPINDDDASRHHSVYDDDDYLYANNEFNDEDDEDGPFIPSPGGGLNTPPPSNNLTTYGAFDNREYYAHPNARLSMDYGNGEHYSSSESTETEGLSIPQMSSNDH